MLILTAEQRAAVGSFHDDLLAGLSRAFDIDRDAQAKQLSLGMRVASFLGALALASSASMCRSSSSRFSTRSALRATMGVMPNDQGSKPPWPMAAGSRLG